MLAALLLALSTASASVRWISEPTVSGLGEDYRATARASMDAPLDAVTAVLHDVAGYGDWVPTVSRVEVVDADGEVVRARLYHVIPLLPDFPCEIVLRYAEVQGRLSVFVEFVECIFDDQSFRVTVESGGQGTLLDIEWSARLDRWYVPDATLRAFLRSSVRAAPERLDARAVPLGAAR